jgi:hypothetical protein
MGEAGGGEGMAQHGHSGTLVKRANPESRDSGFALRAPRNDGGGYRAWLQPAFSLSPGAKNPAKLCEPRDFLASLDFWGLAGMFRATFGKSEPPNA